MRMAIPLIYSLGNLRVRWMSTLAGIAGIAGTVAVFVAMLALAQGFRAAAVDGGSADNALVRRGGAQMEVDSMLTLDEANVIADTLAGHVPGPGGGLASPEVVVIGDFPLRDTGTDAHLQLRGVSPKALAVRQSIRVTSGRFIEPGLSELVIGRHVAASYASFDIGKVVRFGGITWTVVGAFDARGTSFDSEVWADSSTLAQAFQRSPGLFQSVTAHIPSADAYVRFRDALASNPRLTVQVERERDYYERQSRLVTNLLLLLGTAVGLVMAAGAVVGALNTMYSTVTERAHEIACLRAMGFGEGSVVAAILIEAECIALAGGLCGCLVALLLNGVTTRTLNPQTQSYLAFAFQVTPGLLLLGGLFAIVMGLLGGLPPAIRAARAPIAAVLAE
jgi:putative ABC transport system permease protein